MTPWSLHLAQAHLLLVEEIPLPLVGLVSALIPAASRTFIVPRGQAGRERFWVWALPSCQASAGAVMSLMPWQLGAAWKSWPQHGPWGGAGRGGAYGIGSPLIWPWHQAENARLFPGGLGFWPHGPSPAKAPITPAASLIQLRVKAIPLGGPNAGLAPAGSLLQSVQLLPHSRWVQAVVTAFGAGGGRIPEVLGNGSMATPAGGGTAQARGEGPAGQHCSPDL